MADELSKKIDGVKNSVNSASKKELEALEQIAQKLDGIAKNGGDPTSKQPRSVSRRKEELSISTQNGAKSGNNSAQNKQERMNNFLSAQLHTDLSRIEQHLKQKKTTNRDSPNGAKSNNNSTQNGVHLNNKIETNNAETNTKKSTEILNRSASSNTIHPKAARAFQDIAQQSRKQTQERVRNSKGQFIGSAEKTKEIKERADRKKEQAADGDSSPGVVRRLLSALKDKGDPLDGNAANAAGVAGGSLFWQAGKEVYDMGKNTIGSAVGTGKSLKDAITKKDGAATKKSMFGRLFGKKTSSADVQARSLQKETTHELQNQTTVIKEGNQLIVDKLDELTKEKDGKSGGKGGILGRILGGLGKGLIGVLGGIAGGVFGIGKKVGAKLLSGIMSVLGLSKLKKLFGGKGKKSGALDDAADLEDDLSDVGGGRRGRKKHSKEARARKKRMDRARKGKGLKGKLGTLLKVGGGVTAAAAATDAVAGELGDLTDSDDIDEEDTKSSSDEDDGESKAKGKETEKPSETPGAAEAKTAESAEKKATTTVAESAATDVAAGTAGKGAKAVESGVEKAAVKAATSVTEKGAEKAASKLGVKAVSKGALKLGLRAIPVAGQIIGAGIDATTGYMDEDGQRTAFGVADGQEVSGRQKASYTAANVADMGGLVSGGAGLLSAGAKWAGMDKTAKALDFDTGDIARSIDGGMQSVGKGIDGGMQVVGKGLDSIKGFFSKSEDSASDRDKNDDSRNSELIKAVESGAKSTADEVSKVTESLKPENFSKAFEGFSGWWGKAKETAKNAVGTVGDYVQEKYNAATLPTPIANALNIGGTNAGNRSYRNNNFGNLNYVGQKGASLEAANANGERRFASFHTPEEGWRALGNQLLRYDDGTAGAAKKAGHKLQTIDDIFDAYAPDSENNTEAYKNSVAKSLGVQRGETLDLKDPTVMTKMVRAIATVEGGNPNTSDADIAKALGNVGNDGNWHGEFSEKSLDHVNGLRSKQGLKAIQATADYSDPENVGPAATVQAMEKQVVKTAKVVGKKAGEALDSANKFVGKITGQDFKTADIKSAVTTPAPITTNAAGVQFRAADSVTDKDSIINSVIEKVGVNKLLTAEGVRHQITDGGIMAHYNGSVSAGEVGKIRVIGTPGGTGNIDGMQHQAADGGLMASHQSADAVSASEVGKVRVIGGSTAPAGTFTPHEATPEEIAAIKNSSSKTVGKETQTDAELKSQIAAVAAAGNSNATGTVAQTKATTAIIPTAATANDTSSSTQSVRVSNGAVDLGKSAQKTFDQILAELKKISGNTKDANGNDTKKSSNKSPQPGTAGSMPLSISDPVMDQYSSDA